MAQDQRIEEQTEVVPSFRPLRSRGVLGRITGRPYGSVVHGEADVAARHRGLQRLIARNMRPDLVVHRMGCLIDVAHPRRVVAVQVTLGRDDKGLVEGYPVVDPVAQGSGDHRGVIAEPTGDVGVRPATETVEGGGQVPVEKGHKRLDTGGQERVDQAVVIVDAGGVDSAFAVGEHPGPPDGEAVAV